MVRKSPHSRAAKETKARMRNGVLGIATVYGVAGKLRFIAEILSAAQTKATAAEPWAGASRHEAI
jgi:hypothetical protein